MVFCGAAREYSSLRSDRQREGVLSAPLSALFCSRQRVINKCFRCDAIGLAMIEQGAAQCASCLGVPALGGQISGSNKVSRD